MESTHLKPLTTISMGTCSRNILGEAMRMTKKYYETIDYMATITHLPHSFKDHLAQEDAFLKTYIQPGETVLEIGCGYGRSLPLLAQNAKHVTGIDFSELLIAKTKEILQQHIATYLMDATNLRFADNAFDKVVCLGSTFGNFERQELTILKEMLRVAKKEVYFSVINEHAREAHRQFYQNNKFTIIEDTKDYIRLKEGLYSRRFTFEQLDDVLQAATPYTYTLRPLTPISYQAWLQPRMNTLP